MFECRMSDRESRNHSTAFSSQHYPHFLLREIDIDSPVDRILASTITIGTQHFVARLKFILEDGSAKLLGYFYGNRLSAGHNGFRITSHPGLRLQMTYINGVYSFDRYPY